MIRMRCGALLAALAMALPAAAQEAGRVDSVTGVVSVVGADGGIGVLARGSKVNVGDTIDTQAAGYARIKLADGAELALRPNTSLRIDGFRFSESRPQEDSLAMRLLKGGLRTITGLIGKRKPDSFQLNGATATIGIRGTDFVARLCEADCTKDQELADKRRVPPLAGYVGRVLQVQGTLRAAGPGRAPEATAIGPGEIVYGSDVLLTGPRDTAAVAFQDGTRVVLQPGTRLAIDRYRFSPSTTSDNSAAFRLLQGGLRALTGLIGQKNPARFSVTTSVATIGIRGTGFDVQCTGSCVDATGPKLSAAQSCVKAPNAPPNAPCEPPVAPEGVPDGLTATTWKGTIFLKNDAGETDVPEGVAATTPNASVAPRRLDAVPPFFRDNPAPRPDRVPADLVKLFGMQQDDFSEPGMYVHVRDGAVEFKAPAGSYVLAKGETGFFNPAGVRFERLGIVPGFIDKDPYTRHRDFDAFSCGVR
jgi:hypothetical protein